MLTNHKAMANTSLDNNVGLKVSPQTIEWPPCNDGGPAEKISLDRFAPLGTVSWEAGLNQ